MDQANTIIREAEKKHMVIVGTSFIGVYSCTHILVKSYRTPRVFGDKFVTKFGEHQICHQITHQIW